MCGRFSLSTPPEELVEHFGVEAWPDAPPRYNVAPTQAVPVVRGGPEPGSRRVDLLRWGLVPADALDPSVGTTLINARSETVRTKSSFRRAFRRRRCLVPADGFYEWLRRGHHKQPIYFTLENRTPFAFAGLWEEWRQGSENVLESCTILTTHPNDVIRPIHDRMPVILPPDAYAAWLEAEPRDLEATAALLVPYPGEAMRSHPVSTVVNRADQDLPDCIVPVAMPAVPVQGDLFEV